MFIFYRCSINVNVNNGARDAFIRRLLAIQQPAGAETLFEAESLQRVVHSLTAELGIQLWIRNSWSKKQAQKLEIFVQALEFARRTESRKD